MPAPVLLSLDGSTKDERALTVAEAIARLAGAPLHLVHVATNAGAPAALASAALRLAPLAVSHEVIQGDDAADALVRHARQHRPLMIAMATRAAQAMDRALRGSVADEVMRESPVPVLLVPPPTDFLGGKHVRFSRVLVPLDGSDLSLRALDAVLALPHASELEYALLRVVGHPSEQSAAATWLDTVAERVRRAGARDVAAEVIVARDPAAAIVDSVRDALADVIAMSSRGNSGPLRLVIGSVAEGVLRAAEVPVLLVTPAALGR